MLGNLIGGFITILVGVTLIPSVANEVVSAQTYNSTGGTDVRVTGASSTILGLTTLFFALGIAAAGIAIAAQGLRAAGMLGV